MSRVDEPHEPVPVEAELPRARKVVELRFPHLAAEFTNRVDEPAAPTSLPREDQVALRLLGHVATTRSTKTPRALPSRKVSRAPAKPSSRLRRAPSSPDARASISGSTARASPSSCSIMAPSRTSGPRASTSATSTKRRSRRGGARPTSTLEASSGARRRRSASARTTTDRRPRRRSLLFCARPTKIYRHRSRTTTTMSST